jgi:putative DNA-invertase from lambdoid prophage Rac
MSRTFAYYCVSTADQTTDNQVQEIAAAGFAFTKARTIVETVSGSVAAKERKGFARLLDKLEAGDVLIVTTTPRKS